MNLCAAIMWIWFWTHNGKSTRSIRARVFLVSISTRNKIKIEIDVKHVLCCAVLPILFIFIFFQVSLIFNYHRFGRRRRRRRRQSSGSIHSPHFANVKMQFSLSQTHSHFQFASKFTFFVWCLHLKHAVEHQLDVMGSRCERDTKNQWSLENWRKCRW